ncbi:MAG: hypothetical protein ACE5H7_00455 [Acidiferrobacterales bacterium]
MYIAETFMHVKEGLDAGARKILDEKLRQLPGVIAPWLYPEKEHQMLIYYNPTKIEAVTLVARLEALGYHAKIFCL